MIVISLLGKYRPDIVFEITRRITECGGSISDSRMSELAGHFNFIALVNGNWHTPKKLESLSRFAAGNDLQLEIQNGSGTGKPDSMVPYAIDAVCLDQKGVLAQLLDFLNQRGIGIADLSTRGYSASHTAAAMFSIQMVIKIPSNIHISSLREDFLEFCDAINLDAVLEPIKG